MSKKKTKDIQNFEPHDSDIPDKPEGNNYLLAIAINTYTHAPKLANCVKDAEDVIAQLTDRYQFGKDRVFRLFDEQATSPNIYKELQSLSKRIKEHDSIIIYYSGHGYFDPSDKSGHLVPVDAEEDAVWSYISNANFLSRIRAIKSFHTFLIVDSCFSGSLILSKRMDSTALAENVGNYPSRWGLAAGRIELVEDGYHGENSPFSQAILSFLKNNNSAKFPVSDLIQYVKRITPHNSRQTPVGGPLFKVGDSGGEFVFELQKDEVSDWKETNATGTLLAYRTFAAKHPEGKFYLEAISKIKSISAAALWQKIEEADETNTDALKEKLRLVYQYVDKYEDQLHYENALDVGELLEYKNGFFQAKNSEFALLRFLVKPTPNISGAGAIKEEAEQILTNKKKVENDAKAADERQKEALENLRKEKNSLAAKTKKGDEKQKTVKKKPESKPSFFKKYSKILIPILILPFIIWGVIQLLPNNNIGLYIPISTIKIGDFHQGGYVFKIFANGKSGLVCSKKKLDSNLNGLNWYEAKTKCETYEEGGYNDWYLPTKDELNMMYNELPKRKLGDLSRGYYWSSTEVDSNFAWLQHFNDGYQGANEKHFTGNVRAIRAF